MQVDFLIIGQGLAGSLLAWELMRRNCKVIVVDTGGWNASLVAAGIINPVTGMRFVKSPVVDILLPAAQNYYDDLSAFFQQPFYVAKPLLRIFRDEAELDLCNKRRNQAAYEPYLGELSKPDQTITGFKAAFGYIEQHQTGHLLTAPLLARLKQFFIEQNSYRLGTVDYQAIVPDALLYWQDISAKRVIFCEGYQGSQNPWFSWLPFQPAKGEILTLAHQAILPDAILNYGNWLLPLPAGKMRIGATFDREQINTQPSELGKVALLNKLKVFNPSLAKSIVIKHQAGVRPCTPDKYPFIGSHPKISQISIFNGFGAKGSLQIPWYSQQFADYLLTHKPLPHSCDIQRFQARHFVS
jgi:glycine/D-amino acid oxidase-like deaminating enzyme